MSVFDTTGVRSLCYVTGFDWSTQDALFLCTEQVTTMDAGFPCNI
jgi:hypothetical protein